MNRKPFLHSIFVCIFIISGLSSVNAQVLMDIETGAVFSGYNDVRIPGNQGTLFSLSRELDASPAIF